MDSEIIIRKLEAQIIKLENKNRMLKSHLQILISAPASFLAERIRFVNGKTSESIIQMN